MIHKSKLKVELYEASVILLVATSMEEVEHTIKKKTKGTEVDLKETYGCAFSWGDAEYVLALHEDSLSHNLIAHEIFHLAIMITNDIDIDDEESQAWLIGYITEKVYKALKKKKFVIK